MIALTTDNFLSPEDYLEQERHSPIKHEYIDGQAYAMAGTGGIHNIISGNFYLLLRQHLQSSLCRTYFADLKVKVAEGKRFFYPDVLVTCNPNDNPRRAYVEAPTVVIEVLSASTELFDRTQKFHAYRDLPSLQDYVLVSTQDYSVEVFHRTGENTEGDRWLLAPFQGLAAIAHLPSLDLHLPLTEIYATLEPGDLEPAPPMPMSDRHPDEFTDDRTHA